MSFDKFSETLDSEELAFAILGFGDTVGMKNHNVAGIESYAPIVIAGFFKNTQRKTCELDFSAAAVFVEERLGLSSIGDAEFAPAFLPGAETRGHKAAFDAAFANQLIQLAKKFGRL